MESHQIIVLVDPKVQGMSQVADQLEATPCLPSRMAMKQQIDLAREAHDNGPGQIAVVIPWTHPQLVLLAHLLHADRVALYVTPDTPAHSPALHAVFSVVDLTLVPTERSGVRAAALAGADPDRIANPGPEGMTRLFREPPRKPLTKATFEMATSLFFDLSAQSGLLEWWERMTPDRGVNIVNYHRILPLDEIVSYGRPQMALAEPIFEAQLASMAQHRGFISVDRIHEVDAQGRVAITFDDGYEDNFRVALPLLERFSAPACIFIVTGLIGHPEALWWDRVAWSLFGWWKAGATGPVSKTLPKRSAQLKTVTSFVHARTLISEILSELNQASKQEREQAVKAAQELVTQLPAPRTMLTWDEVKTLAKAGINFGSHTRSHVPLDELSKEVAEEELMGSQADLDTQIGPVPYATTALPRGRMGAVTENDLRARFKSVMTTNPGVHNPNDPSLFVPRRDGRMLTLSGRHHPAKLRWELTGIIDRLRRAYYATTGQSPD